MTDLCPIVSGCLSLKQTTGLTTIVLLNDKYSGWHFGKQALNCLASTVRILHVKPDMAGSMFVGFMADEGSAHGRAQLISFYRLCVRGRPKVRFAGLDRLLNGKARTKTLTVLNRWRKDKVSTQKVSCFGSDCDATFSGCRTGVVARLFEFCLLMVAFHVFCTKFRSARGMPLKLCLTCRRISLIFWSSLGDTMMTLLNGWPFWRNSRSRSWDRC